MNKYKKLLSNTALFAISTFSSRVLVFLLMPLYTSVLTPAQYSTVDLTIQMANLLIPLVSLGVMNAVVRFGLDKGYSPKGVFTSGVYAIALGYIVFMLFFPLLNGNKYLSFLDGNLMLMYVYVLMACLRSLFSQFVRSRSYTRLYAVDGLLSSVFTIFFNVLFLVGFEWGVTGYLLAIVCADVVSCLFLFTVAGLHRFFAPSAVKKSVFTEMLKYSLPLVPASIFWWVTNVSDRYMVAAMVGEAANGLYAASCKIPTIITLFSTIFTEAWQLSAVSEKDSQNLSRFFTTIFSALQGVAFTAGALLIATAKISTGLLVSDTFFEAWQTTPILIIAMVFSCFSNFLASVYMVNKKSMSNLVTTFLGAGVNIALNLYTIPKIGVYGAAISTAVSYLLVFVVRAVTSQKYIRIRYAPVKLILNTALLCLQSALMITGAENWALWVTLAAAGVLALNGGPMLRGAKKMLQMLRTRQ